ncbi:MAG: sugar transferase [Limnothrix sp. CACIAM 69d]|nr:MAG: sugar transferase [Limnothrix sp. CACIAM 69d]
MLAKSPSVASRAGRSTSRRSLGPAVISNLNADFVKRLFDIVFSLFVLIVFSPLYLLLIALVAFSSPGPVFYTQSRVGKNFRRFRCIKFRTMVVNADEMLAAMIAKDPALRAEYAATCKLKRDPRITWIGRLLRVTSLDEFPQFLNVLLGDMSVVGPRPLVPEELPMYGRHIHKVLTVKPGITGLWQVSGRNDIPYDRRISIDVYYASARNLWLDIWIVLKTLWVVVATKENGAY